MSVRSLELREEAGRLVTEARGILNVAEAEKRAMTEDETKRFDALHADAESRLATAERMERQATADDAFAPPASPTPRTSVDGERQAPQPAERLGRADLRAMDPESRMRLADHLNARSAREYEAAERAFLRGGSAGLTAEQRATLQVTSDIGGGYLAPSVRFINQLINDVDDQVMFRQFATVYTVGYTEDLGVPTLDGDISDFEWGAAELAEAGEDTGLAFGKREFKVRPFKRKTVKISRRLLENAMMNVEAIVSARVSVALARTLEAAYMTGDGNGKPLGLFTASDQGIPTSRDVVSGAATTLTADGLFNLQDSLKAQYQPRARFLLHRNTQTIVRKLKDGNGQYLWQPGLQTGVPNTLLGSPLMLSEFAPNTYTGNAYVAIYGDFSHYWIADGVANMRIQRLVELYAATGQIGLLFDNIGVDGMPIMAEAFSRLKLAAA